MTVSLVLEMSDVLPKSHDRMPRNFRILAFSDLTPEIDSKLDKQLQVGRTNPLLGVFLERVGVALRQEVATNSSFERQRVPTFSTIHDLVKNFSSTKASHAGVQCALLTISQIAQYFEYVLPPLAANVTDGDQVRRR